MNNEFLDAGNNPENGNNSGCASIENDNMEQLIKERVAFIEKRQKEIDPKSVENEKNLTMEDKIKSIPIEQIQDCFEKKRMGDAILYNYLHRDLVVFVEEWNKFLVWVGHHWDLDTSTAYESIENVCLCYERLLIDCKKKCKDEDDKNQKRLYQTQINDIKRRLDCLRDIPARENLMKMVRQVKNPLSILADKLDKKHYLKACPNGVIDLVTGRLLPGRQEDYLLNTIPTEYDPALLNVDDPCPQTNAFLLSSMNGNKEVVAFIWRVLGYGLITDRKDHVYLIFWGEHGRNGKDTLIKLVTHVIGSKLSTDVNVEMFLQSTQNKNSSAPSPDIMALRGTCFAWINEAEENQRFAHGKLKKLSGGSLITARTLQDKELTTWEQTHLPIMTTNEIPKANAYDSALWQRTIVVKWPVSFVDEPKEPYERKADKNLEERLKEEAKGILARMVQGAMEYQNIGLAIPDVVKEWTQEQRASSDDVGSFINDYCELEPYKDTYKQYEWVESSSSLYAAFKSWYKDNRDSRERYQVSAKKFGELLNKKGIPQDRKRNLTTGKQERVRLGIRLNEEGLQALVSDSNV